MAVPFGAGRSTASTEASVVGQSELQSRGSPVDLCGVTVGEQVWRSDLASARLWAADRAPYLAAALFALRTTPTHGLGTFAVDRFWRLYVDPECFGRWSVPEAGSVLIHEVHHLLRDHAGRAELVERDGFEHRRFNVAADIEINDDLADLQLPGGACTPERFGFPAGELAEAYYGLLGSGGSLPIADCGSGADGVSRDWELGPAEDVVGPAEGVLIRDQVARAIRSEPGKAPAGLARWANSVLTATVDWRRELRGLVRSGVAHVAGAVDYTYRRPSRRTTLVRPAVVPAALTRPVPRVAIVVDTSGSMGNDELAVALAEAGAVIVEGVASTEPVAVIACDTSVTVSQRVMTVAGVELVGGGGTDMRAGIDAAAGLRPRPQLVVVLTDGATPWPDTPPRGVTVVIALIGEYGSVPPWARTVRIPVG